MAKANAGQEEAAARAALETAHANLDREAARLQATEREIAALTVQVQTTDPDDDRGFAKLTQARDAARGRLEAFQVRFEAAQTALSRAQGAVEEIERAVRAKQLAELEAQIAEADRAITESCVRFRAELVARIAELRALTDAAATLDPRPWNANPRGTKWGGVSVSEAMLVAAGAVGGLR